jgi:hypothetical protein
MEEDLKRAEVGRNSQVSLERLFQRLPEGRPADTSRNAD